MARSSSRRSSRRFTRKQIRAIHSKSKRSPARRLSGLRSSSYKISYSPSKSTSVFGNSNRKTVKINFSNFLSSRYKTKTDEGILKYKRRKQTTSE